LNTETPFLKYGVISKRAPVEFRDKAGSKPAHMGSPAICFYGKQAQKRSVKSPEKGDAAPATNSWGGIALG